MKIATYRVGGERRVGLVDERRQTVSPFDIPEAEAAHGVLALIDRPTLPRVLSPMPLREAVLEAPIPRPAAQHLLRRQELSRARPGIRRERLRFQRRRRRGAEASRSSFPRCPNASSRIATPVSIDRARLAGGRLRGRTRRHHRQGRARHQAGRRARSRLGLYDHQRRDRARSAGALQPMADRQIAGHVLPDGALGGHAGRDRSRRHAGSNAGSTANCARTPIRAISSSTSRRSSQPSRPA